MKILAKTEECPEGEYLEERRDGADDDRIACEGCGKMMKPEEVAWRYLDGPELCAACAPTPEQSEAERKECRAANTDDNKFECLSLEHCRFAETCQDEAADLADQSEQVDEEISNWAD